MTLATESPNPVRLEAVVFDCDGVLVDSEPIHDAATREEMKARGISLSDSFFDEHIGMRVEDQMRVLGAQFGFDAAELYRAREARFWAITENRDIPQVPGSAATVRAVAEAGMAVAVATSGNRLWVRHVLDQLDISQYVRSAISGDDVTEPKPSPEPYLAACAAVGVEAARAGVVEDSARGVRSAAAAGCRVLLLDRSHSFPARVAGATFIVDNFDDARAFLLFEANELR